jgi:hypothetical protein
MRRLNRKSKRYLEFASGTDRFGTKVAAIILTFIAVFFIIAIVFLSLPARAHDHNRPDLDSWYRGLGSARSPCCTGAEEGVKLLDADWRMDHLEDCKITDGQIYGQNAIGTQYCVKMYGAWWLVPDNSIVKGVNLEGVAIVWPLLSYGIKDEKQVNIRCFMPAPAY